TPETRSAQAAVQDVAAAVTSRRPYYLPNPLLLHGLAGSGKTHLASALVAEVTRQCPKVVVTVMAARDLADCGVEDEPNALNDGRQSDLLVVEDLQHLPPWAAGTLAQLVDCLHARLCPMVFTALAGPRHLESVSGRLASRLVGGLVVGLEPLSA